MASDEVPHRKRLRHYETEGKAHALTFSCFRRKPFLSRDRSRQWVVDAIERARVEHGFHLWAFVVMPEHVHLLILPRDAGAAVGAILSSIKQSVAKRALRFVQNHAPQFLPQMEDRRPDGSVFHRFWTRAGGYDTNVPDARTAFAEIDYIHANPVRRGLCARPADWLWSSAREYESPGSSLLRIDRESLP